MNEVKFKANIKDLASLQATVSEIPEIPTPATTDEGKVLTVSVVSSGETPVAEYDLAAPASGLPAIGAGDAGKVLTVNENHTAAVWAAVPAELPAIGDSDAGKVLTVNSGHTAAEWAAAGGGNSPLIVHSTYDETDHYYHLDKTFGEIRSAINAGRSVLVVSADTSSSFDSNITTQIGGYSYTIGLNPEYPEASGNVSTTVAQMTFDVVCDSAPYTLAALDALYPSGQ